MQLTLLGTGSAEGWPNPFCTCASCTTAHETGSLRGQTSVLVDGVLLLDIGPEAPRAALRAGTTLAGVRHVLVGHSHPDHLAPAALLWRSWAGRTEPVDLVGPPAVISACADWIGRWDPVSLRSVAAGERLTVGGYDVRVLPAEHGDVSTGQCVLYDVTGPDGARLLYATDTGPLSSAALDATAGRAYDAVLLEETFGDADGQPSRHLDLTTFPAALAELRRRGAVTETTRVVAVHLGHRNPPGPELARRLAAWGAELHADGAVLDVGPSTWTPAALRRKAPRRVLLLGGARSGKSAEAERRLAAEPAVTYVATSPAAGDGAADGAVDAEWAARVDAHRRRRPAAWTTVETTDLEPLLAAPPGGAPLLIDDLGLWLTAVMHHSGAWQELAGSAAAIETATDRLVTAWQATSAHAVLVANEVGSGIVPATASGRLFRDELGRLTARLAAESDEVWQLVAGIPRRLR